MIVDWINSHQIFLTWFSLISAVVFFLSLFTLPWLASRIPEDYFSHGKRLPAQWKSYHPLTRIAFLFGKNLLGLILLAGGFLMLFIPGQGLLTMVAGLLLIDYPGKYQLERKLISVPTIGKGINWLRKRRNQPPIIIDRGHSQ